MRTNDSFLSVLDRVPFVIDSTHERAPANEQARNQDQEPHYFCDGGVGIRALAASTAAF